MEPFSPIIPHFHDFAAILCCNRRKAAWMEEIMPQKFLVLFLLVE